MSTLEATEVSIRGKRVQVRSARVGGATVVVTGRFLRIARVHDADFLEGHTVADPPAFLQQLKASGIKADLFTFAEPLTSAAPRHPYPFEWDNAAVANASDYEAWWSSVPQESRKNVRRSAKRGVTVDRAPFDTRLIEGIKGLYDESPIRQGRRFWHFGKDLDTVRRDNSSYLDRSEFIGAYHAGELIGFIKIVFVDKVARIMQILAFAAHQDKRPMNALLAKAMEVCSQRGMTCLVYSKFQFGNKKNDDMAEFKRRNGFTQLNFPVYYVPLTLRGRVAFALKWHRGLLGLLPAEAIQFLARWRTRLLAMRSPGSRNGGVAPAPPSQTDGERDIG